MSSKNRNFWSTQVTCELSLHLHTICQMPLKHWKYACAWTSWKHATWGDVLSLRSGIYGNVTLYAINVLAFKRLTPLSTIFQFYRGGNRSTRRKVTDKLYHIMLYRVHFVLAGFELTTLVVTDTDYIGSYKSNYHMITSTTAPLIT